MRRPTSLAVVAAVGLVLATATAASVRADPSATRCAVTTPSGSITAAFELGSMTGTVSADGAVGTRRFNVKAMPSGATYVLLFQGYGAGDQKPTGESLTKTKSIVARLVAYGDTNHLFVDGDWHPKVQAPADGFVCP